MTCKCGSDKCTMGPPATREELTALFSESFPGQNVEPMVDQFLTQATERGLNPSLEETKIWLDAVINAMKGL